MDFLFRFATEICYQCPNRAIGFQQWKISMTTMKSFYSLSNYDVHFLSARSCGDEEHRARAALPTKLWISATYLCDCHFVIEGAAACRNICAPRWLAIKDVPLNYLSRWYSSCGTRKPHKILQFVIFACRKLLFLGARSRCRQVQKGRGGACCTKV